MMWNMEKEAICPTFPIRLGTEYGYVFPLSSRFCLHLFPVWQLASAIQMEQKTTEKGHSPILYVVDW